MLVTMPIGYAPQKHHYHLVTYFIKAVCRSSKYQFLSELRAADGDSVDKTEMRNN